MVSNQYTEYMSTAPGIHMGTDHIIGGRSVSTAREVIIARFADRTAGPSAWSLSRGFTSDAYDDNADLAFTAKEMRSAFSKLVREGTIETKRDSLHLTRLHYRLKGLDA